MKIIAPLIPRLLLILLPVLLCSCHTKPDQVQKESELLKYVYIDGIHDDPQILTADSLFLKGKLKEAASLFSKQKTNTSKQLYCQARLAQLDYYMRELYGISYHNKAIKRELLPSPSNSIDSFLLSIHYFYTEEDLDTNFFRLWIKVGDILGKDHFLVNLGNAMLGENYYSFCFDSNLSNTYFGNHLDWCHHLGYKIYDCFWTKIRLTNTGTYFRDNLASLIQANELIEEAAWIGILDSVHLSLAYSNRGYIQFRFPKFEEGFADNQKAIQLASSTKAIPVYQEALKSQLTVTSFWKKDSLWQICHQMLLKSINDSGEDYINYNRLVARFYFEKSDYKHSIPFQDKAIDFEMHKSHINMPVLASLANLHSIELESEGLFSKAIQTYRISEISYSDSTCEFDDLIDPMLLNQDYEFVSLTRYGHIYFSWYLADRDKDHLVKADYLAQMAHQYYYRDMLTLDENQLLTFAYERQIVLELFCYIYSEKYFITHDPHDLEQYYSYAEENRGAIFSRDMKAMWTKYPVPTEWLMKEQRLRAENKRILGNTIVDQDKIKANRDSIKSLLNKIKETYPDYFRTILDQESIALSVVQDSLKEKRESILSFDIIGPDLYLLWITENGADLSKINLDTNRLGQLEKLINIMSTRNKIQAEEYATLAYKVWDWLIPDTLKSKEHASWVVIPDGYFHRMNLEALVTDSDSSAAYGTMQYLIYERDIVYSPSIKTWMRPRNPPAKKERIVAMGWSDEETNDELRDSILPELSGAYKEVEAIRTSFPDSKVYTGWSATRKNFIRNYTDPDVTTMHLAVHGYASSVKQDNIKLYFRGKNFGIDSLFGYDLLPLTSNVRTIIMSACESGKGTEKEGEGNYDLPRYFLINGANEVISSLWILDDDSSSELFSNYYRNSSPAYSSLGRSKCDMIRRKNGKHAVPFFWAGLVAQK